jgi:phospholipase/carboxylesterase
MSMSMGMRSVETAHAVEIETGPQPSAAVIWLHGLGADGHDFEPIVPQLVDDATPALRFVFPHAPVRPVTLNGGARMRAWYDILGLDRHAVQDEEGVRVADQRVRHFIEQEQQRGVRPDRIVLAGFSQGGAMALYTALRLRERLAGVIALSCYLLLSARFAERHSANQATPILLAHGRFDPVVDPQFGVETRGMLEQAGYAVEWHEYPMGHAVCPEEIEAIGAFLRRVLRAS